MADALMGLGAGNKVRGLEGPMVTGLVLSAPGKADNAQTSFVNGGLPGNAAFTWEGAFLAQRGSSLMPSPYGTLGVAARRRTWPTG